MITRRPITPVQVEQGAEALWELSREIDGRYPWGDAPEGARDLWRRKAIAVLEAALPADAHWLRRFAKRCGEAADVIG